MPSFRTIQAARTVVVCTVSGIAFSLPSMAAPKPAPTTSCATTSRALHTATRISDARSLTVDGNQEITLAGLLVPSAVDAAARPSGSWPLETAARRALEGLVKGRSIALAFTSDHTDRYGRRPSHIFVREASRVLWLQAELVRLGLARVDAVTLSEKCSASLLAIEATSRRRGAGLWAHAAYQIRDASDDRGLLRFRSTFQIVEGLISRASRARHLVYINFGRQWRRDFTIGIGARLWRQLEAKGLRLETLAGKRVRVRGWIERRGGPFIYLRSPQELELLPPSSPTNQPPPAAAPTDSTESPPQSAPPQKEKRPAASPPGTLDL